MRQIFEFSFIFSLLSVLSISLFGSSIAARRNTMYPPNRLPLSSSILVEHHPSTNKQGPNDASESLSKLPSSSPPSVNSLPPCPHPPILIWHGLGDSYDSGGMKSIMDLLEDTLSHSHTYDDDDDTISINLNVGSKRQIPPAIYSINLTSSSSADQLAGYIGHVPTQLSTVCDAIAIHPVLSIAPLIHIIGFSQGGLFARGLVQTCEMLPRVGVLMTFGSPHMGIGELGSCDDGGKRKGGVEDDGSEFYRNYIGDDDVDVTNEPLNQQGFWGCEAMLNYAKRNIWGDGVQRRVVPTQYFRSVHLLGREDNDDGKKDIVSVPNRKYLEHSGWLADINCERRPTESKEGEQQEGQGEEELKLYNVQQQRLQQQQLLYQNPPAKHKFYLDDSSSRNEERNTGLNTGYRNSTFYKHLTRMDRFVMVRFADEQLINPPASTWFGQGGPMDKGDDEHYLGNQNYNNNVESNDIDIDIGIINDKNKNKSWSLPLTAWPGYKHDWLGLRTLDEKRKLAFETVAGEHMRFSDEAFGRLAELYLGGYY